MYSTIIVHENTLQQPSQSTNNLQNPNGCHVYSKEMLFVFKYLSTTKKQEQQILDNVFYPKVEQIDETLNSIIFKNKTNIIRFIHSILYTTTTTVLSMDLMEMWC